MDKFLNDNNERLIRYIDGELEAGDKLELERELQHNPLLQAELDNLLLAKESIRLYGLKQQVAGIHQQVMGEMGKSQHRQKAGVRQIVRYSLAAAAVILLFSIGLKTYNNYTPSADTLFKEQYHAYELGAFRDADTISHSAIEESYRDKDYRKVTLLSQQQDSAGIKDVFLEGIACLELGDINQGILKFRTVIEHAGNHSESIFKDAAEYYLSLSYLKARDYNQALAIMRSIQSNPGHLYHDKITMRFMAKVGRLK